MNKTNVSLLLSFLMLASPVMAAQSKYLGKKPEDKKEEAEITYPKVNLLSSDIISHNPHFLNQEFWLESNSSKIIGSEVAPKELSEKLFDLVKGSASDSSSDDAVSESEGKDEGEKIGKDFLPPKTALIGYDHHHRYSEIEKSFGGNYSASVISSNMNGETVLFRTTGKHWAVGSEQQPILVTNISVSSDNPLSYLEQHTEIALTIAQNFMETLLPISKDDLSFHIVNENEDEIKAAAYNHVLRDICVENTSNGEYLVVRMTVKTNDMSVDKLKVFSGMECGA